MLFDKRILCAFLAYITTLPSLTSATTIQSLENARVASPVVARALDRRSVLDAATCSPERLAVMMKALSDCTELATKVSNFALNGDAKYLQTYFGADDQATRQKVSDNYQVFANDCRNALNGMVASGNPAVDNSVTLGPPAPTAAPPDLRVATTLQTVAIRPSLLPLPFFKRVRRSASPEPQLFPGIAAPPPRTPGDVKFLCGPPPEDPGPCAAGNAVAFASVSTAGTNTINPCDSFYVNSSASVITETPADCNIFDRASTLMHELSHAEFFTQDEKPQEGESKVNWSYSYNFFTTAVALRCLDGGPGGPGLGLE